MRILLIDDDPAFTSFVASQFRRIGAEVVACQRGEDGVRAAVGQMFDLLLVDIEMPGLSGHQVIEELRSQGMSTPIMVLTSGSGVPDVVRALDAGADDYMRKPFAMAELTARVRALRRRVVRRSHDPLKFGDIELDEVDDTAYRSGYPLRLTPIEFKLLHALLRSGGEPVSRGELRDAGWGSRFDPGTDALSVHVSNLRKKLEANGRSRAIETVRGTGYRLSWVAR